MQRDPQHRLSPGLERQLARIEQMGNAEADLVREEQLQQLEKAQEPLRMLAAQRGESAHRLHTLRQRYMRESERTRKFGIILLCISPLLSLAYLVAIAHQQRTLALVLLLLSGLLIGLAMPALYYANKRQQKLEEDV